jgi:Uma2 family endonuclease
MSLDRLRGRFTYEELCRLPDDGLRHEIIRGEHVVTPSPRFRHQVLVTRIVTAIGAYLEAHPIGTLLAGPYDLLLEGGDVLVPDVLFMTPATLERNTALNLHGAPDLAVEVLSPSTGQRDLGVKRDLYESGGAREYWAVDPVGRRILAFIAGEDGRFAPPVELSADRGDSLVSGLFPGFSLPLELLFA